MKKVKTKTLTPNQLAYQKELKRLNRGIKRYQRKGVYIPNEEALPTEIPKRVTKKKLEEIRNLKPIDVVNRAGGRYVNRETGETTTIQEYNRQRRSKGQQKRRKRERNIPQESKQPTADYYPNISIIERIKDAIRVIPPKRNERAGTRWKLLEEETNELMNILDDNISTAELDDNLTGLIEYYKDNQGTIFTLLEVVYYDSDQNNVNNSLVQVGIILNGGNSLTPSQAENISEMGDYNSYDDTEI